MVKKITSALLAATLAAGIVAIPTSAERFESASPNSLSVIQPRSAAWTVIGTYVRMRREPTIYSEAIMQLEYGEIVYEVAGSVHTEADGYTWINVYSNRTGWSGWVASDYLQSNDY